MTSPTTSTATATPADRFRFNAALMITATVIGLALFFPAGRWAVEQLDIARPDAAIGAIESGWWAVQMLVVLVAFAALTAVVIAAGEHRNWRRMAWRTSLMLVSVLATSWVVWICTALGAAGQANS